MKIEMKAENFAGVNAEVSEQLLNGEQVIRVVKGQEKLMRYDENTYAKLQNVLFHNGMIQVSMLSRLLPDAPDFARGFIGIAYRISANDAEFESFYIRPTNAMTDDPVRQAHGCQYFSYPGYTFSYFREFGITDYEAPISSGLDEWVTLRAVIRNAEAHFYLNDMEKPLLVVPEMKHGKGTAGNIGFFVDIGTEAFFKGLIIQPE